MHLQLGLSFSFFLFVDAILSFFFERVSKENCQGITFVSSSSSLALNVIYLGRCRPSERCNCLHLEKSATHALQMENILAAETKCLSNMRILPSKVVLEKFMFHCFAQIANASDKKKLSLSSFVEE